MPEVGYTKPNDREIVVLRDDHGKALGIEKTEGFGSEGGYGPVQDWAKVPQGKALLDHPSFTRSPALLWWLSVQRKASSSPLENQEGERLAQRGSKPIGLQTAHHGSTTSEKARRHLYV